MVGDDRREVPAEVAAAPHGRANPGEQLLDAEGLRHVVVGPEVEGLDLVVGLVPGRQHDDRHDRRGADAAQHLGAVEVGQPEVEDDDVGRVLGHRLHRGAAVGGGHDLVAVGPQGDRQRALQPRVVVDDEHSGHASSC